MLILPSLSSFSLTQRKKAKAHLISTTGQLLSLDISLTLQTPNELILENRPGLLCRCGGIFVHFYLVFCAVPHNVG